MRPRCRKMEGDDIPIPFYPIPTNSLMARIRQLPSSVVTKIAAGEVIERPASVVKELLENALDAGSTRIDVEVVQGGIDLIRVVDDGCGIPSEDLLLAFASHATSKLAGADDLFAIGTFGFRGEALASVGGVAQVALQSRSQGEPFGAEVTCHGGQLSAVRPWNGATGTRVEVRHLFYNVPVRRKFLRGPAAEMGQVAEVFMRLALSPRAPHLTLRHNGKLVHEVPLSSDPLDRVALFFGPEVRGRLLAVGAQQGTLRLEGYVADPVCERGGAGMQYLYVNGRWVRDRVLFQALAGGVSRPVDDRKACRCLSLSGCAARSGRCQCSPGQVRSPLPRPRRCPRLGAGSGS